MVFGGVKVNSQLRSMNAEMRGGDRGLEGDVLAEVVLIGDMADIGENVRLGRLFLRPAPFLLQLVIK
jgi:hypothetical protein